MKNLGIIGGVSWESTAVYYKLINEHIKEQLGGLHSAPIILFSMNYQELVAELLKSPINEVRLLALMILVERYQKSNSSIQTEIFQLYLSHISHINNWNLVDASAHYIVGAHLYSQDKNLLIELASSNLMWERRIAIVSTWYFIRKNEFEWTIKIAEILLSDQHDLIHKAVGWMLREMGKRDETHLILFLNQHISQMPRTMLRYAIEKLGNEHKRMYMTQK